MKKFISLFLFQLLIASYSFAGEWVQIGDFYKENDNYLYKIALFDSLNFGVLGQTAGAVNNKYYGYNYYFSTTDGGKTWSESRLSEYKESAVYDDFNNVSYLSAKHIIATATDGKILNSFNSGESWDSTRFNNDTNMSLNRLFVSVNKKYSAIINNNNIALYSTDSCKTWKSIVLDTTNGIYYYYPRIFNDTTFYIDQCNNKSNTFRLLHSKDLFKTSDSYLVDTLIRGDVSFVNDKLGFYSYNTVKPKGAFLRKTTDGGKTWKEVDFAKYDEPTESGYAFAIVNDSTYYYSGPLGVYKSYNYGENWAYIPIKSTGVSEDDYTTVDAISGNNRQLLLTSRYLLKYEETPSRVEDVAKFGTLTLSPNPVTPGQIVNLNYTGQESGEAEYIIYGVSGNIISQGAININGGSIQLATPNGISSGVYNILLIVNSKSIYSKFTVIK